MAEGAKSAAIQILNKKKAAAKAAAAEPAETAEVETEEAGTETEEDAVETETAEEEAVAEGEATSAEGDGGGDPEPEPEPVKKKGVQIKKAPAKAAAGTKTEAKPKTVSSDEIQTTAAGIETMSEATAIKELQLLIENQSLDQFKMGGILSKMLSEKWHGEHPNFRSMVEAEFGVKYRTAMMWISMYNNLVESKVPYSKVKRLGWTKIAYLSAILTVENVDEVLSQVDGMTALQVQAFVDEYSKSGDAKKAAENEDVNQLKSKTFKLFPGQKESVDLAIEKARTSANTDSDSAALEFICVDFLSGNVSSKKTTPKPAPKEELGEQVAIPTSSADFIPLFEHIRDNDETIEEAITVILEAFQEVFPSVTLNVTID